MKNQNSNKKQSLITTFFTKDVKEIKENKNIKKEDSWYCIECGVDMGPNNPRQFCGKYMCFNYGMKIE